MQYLLRARKVMKSIFVSAIIACTVVLSTAAAGQTTWVPHDWKYIGYVTPTVLAAQHTDRAKVFIDPNFLLQNNSATRFAYWMKVDWFDNMGNSVFLEFTDCTNNYGGTIFSKPMGSRWISLPLSTLKSLRKFARDSKNNGANANIKLLTIEQNLATEGLLGTANLHGRNALGIAARYICYK